MEKKYLDDTGLSNLLENLAGIINTQASSIYGNLSSKFYNYLPLQGGTLYGDLYTCNVIPVSTDTYNLGTTDVKWNNVYATNFVGNASTATEVSNSLTCGTKTYNGSKAVEIVAADLGLSYALKYIGITNTALTDDDKTQTIDLYGDLVTVSNGDVVFYDNNEFVWNGSKWELLGGDVKHPEELPNPKVIKFKDISGTDQIYDGSDEVDLTAGINYAASAGTAVDQTARDAASTAQTTAEGKWTYDANTIKNVKVNNAVNADALTVTSKGSVTRPIYWDENGQPAECTHYLNATVPSDADFNNYYPTSFSWTNGNQKGPTGSLTVPGTDGVKFEAIPSASDSNSGVVTTANQTFVGVKTFDEGIVVSSTDGVSWGNQKITGSDLNGFVFSHKYDDGDKVTYNDYLIIDRWHILPRDAGYIYDDMVDGISLGVSNHRFAQGYFLGEVYSLAGFYETSDARMKNFSTTITCDLDKLAQLPKKYFTWKSDPTNKLHIGTSAQAVQEIYPELVSEDENGTLSVAYDKFSVVALAAVDKLHEEVKALKNKNQELEDRISKLENLLLYGKGV